MAVHRTKHIVDHYLNYHLLPAANAKVANTIDELFDMSLLECLDVYVPSQALLCYYGLYLQWLQCTNTKLF